MPSRPVSTLRTRPAASCRPGKVLALREPTLPHAHRTARDRYPATWLPALSRMRSYVPLVAAEGAGHRRVRRRGYVIDRTYSLSETPAAIHYMRDGHAQGKVVINL
jgi:hypothetical protein